MPVFFEPHRAEIGQRRVQSSSVVPEHPGDDFVHRLAPGRKALSMKAFHLQVDVDSVKSYIVWLCTEAELITLQKKNQPLRQARMRISAIVDGVHVT